jgi:hypothetical protein
MFGSEANKVASIVFFVFALGLSGCNPFDKSEMIYFVGPNDLEDQTAAGLFEDDNLYMVRGVLSFEDERYLVGTAPGTRLTLSDVHEEYKPCLDGEIGSIVQVLGRYNSEISALNEVSYVVGDQKPEDEACGSDGASGQMQ